MEAYYCITPIRGYETIASHTFLLFKFKPTMFSNTKGDRARGLVVSVEARPEKNYHFSGAFDPAIYDGMQILWLLASWPEYLTNTYKTLGQDVYLRKMLLSKEQTRQLLINSLQGAVKNRDGERYHVLRNNCTNNATMQINTILQPQDRIPLKGNFPFPGCLNRDASFPYEAEAALVKKGIISDVALKITPSNYEQYLQLFGNPLVDELIDQLGQ